MRKGRFAGPVAGKAQRYTESVRSPLPVLFRWMNEAGLREIEREIARGKFKWDLWLEDVHMNIEAAPTQKIAAVGAKLHTARSRNDQIALDLRLYVKAEIGSQIRLTGKFGKVAAIQLRLATREGR
jgi:argininosuccinate lyase